MSEFTPNIEKKKGSNTNSRFAQQFILIGIFNIFLSAKSFLLIPLLTRNLSIENYGLYEIYITSVTFVPLIITLGLPYTAVRFLAGEEKKENIREIYYSIFFLVLVISSIVGSFFFIFGLFLLNSINIQLVVIVLGLVILPESLILVTLDFLRAKRLVVYYTFFKSFQVILIISITAFSILSPIKFLGSLAAVLLSDLVILFGTFFFIFARIGFQFPKFNQLGEYLSFGIPILFTNLSYLLVSSFDRYLIAFLLGVSYVGYYSPAYTISTIFTIFAAPFGFLLPAILSKLFDEGNIIQIKNILENSVSLYLFFSIPSIFGISVLSREILYILSTEEIANRSFMLIPLISLGCVLWGIYIISSQVLVITKKTSVTGKIWIGAALLNIIINSILILSFGLIGAALSSMVSYGVVAFCTSFASLRSFSYTLLEKKFILKSITASSLMAFVIIYLNPRGLFQLFMVFCLGGFLYFLLMVLFKGITRDNISSIKQSLLN